MAKPEPKDHHWFDCQLPEVVERFDAEARCPVCGAEWYAVESGWRSREHGTIREADMSQLVAPPATEGSDALPEVLKRKGRRGPARPAGEEVFNGNRERRMGRRR